MNIKLIITVAVIFLLGGGIGAYFMTRGSGSNSTASSNSTTPAQELGQPTRTAEIRGVVKSIEGNELIVANEINTVELTDEEKAARKAERQAMSQEERQALKAEETAAAETESVTITVPVGVQMVKSTGDATGDLVDAQLSDVQVGTYVSIWVQDYNTDTADVEFVKVKPTF